MGQGICHYPRKYFMRRETIQIVGTSARSSIWYYPRLQSERGRDQEISLFLVPADSCL